MVTDYLIKKGHTKIGFVGNINSTSAIADRYFGYVKALTENKISVNQIWHINANIEKTSDIIELNIKDYQLLLSGHCDAAARWLYTALASKGVKCT
jgi:LacI family transcriptional regulator